MSKASIIVFIICATLFIPNHVSSYWDLPTEPHFFYQTCQIEFGNYTANSTYETNLKAVLSTLQDHASQEPFFNTSAGKGANAVYGQFNCRGDVGSKVCSECVQAAAQDALKNCSSVKAAVVWYEECTLRFRNESMFGIRNPDDTGSYVYSLSDVSDPDKFIAAFNDTMKTLVEKAAYGNDTTKFATGEAVLSAFETLYSLVQCSPDINGTDCETCLDWCLSFIEKPCCGKWSVGVYVLFPSCQMIYSTMDPFYDTPNAPPPPPSPPVRGSPPPRPKSPPSTADTTTTTTAPPPPPNNNGGWRIVNDNLKLGIVTAALLLIVNI